MNACFLFTRSRPRAVVIGILLSLAASGPAAAAESWPGPLQTRAVLTRPATLPAGAFGPVFTLAGGRLAVWQARDWGRVAVFDLADPAAPTARTVIAAPDATYDNPSFGAKLAFLGPDRLFIGNPFTWVSAPHDGRIYAYDLAAPTPELAYRQAQDPHSAGYFGWEVSLAGDLLVSAQGPNGGSWQTRSATFIYRINADRTLTLIGRRDRSDFLGATGAVVTGDHVAITWSHGTGAGQLEVSRVHRQGGVPTAVASTVTVALPESSVTPIRAQPNGGSSFFRLAAEGNLLAVSHHGAEADAGDNRVFLYRIEDGSGGLAVTPVSTLTPPAGASPVWGRRVAFAWGHLLVSDPLAPIIPMNGRGIVHIHEVSDAASPRLVDSFISERHMLPGAFGDFLAFDRATGPRGTLIVGRRTDAANLGADHELEVFTPPDHLPPVFTTPPASLTVAAGTLATLTATATGTPAPTFQWYRGGLALPGQTGANLEFPGVQPADAGTYHVVARNAGGTVSSPAAVLTVTPAATAPVITAHPEPVVSGAPVTLSVTATGTPPLTYEWLRDGNPTVIGTGSSLLRQNVLPGEAGLYYARVSNGMGTVTSRPARLLPATAATTPSLRVDLAGAAQYAAGGGTARVRVTLNLGPLPPSALGVTLELPEGWSHVATEGAQIPEIQPAPGNRANLDFAYTAPPAGEASFEVVVAYAAGLTGLQTITGAATYRAPLQVLTASPVSLVRIDAPAIVSAPVGRGVIAGSSVTFAVVARSSAGLTFQWRRDGADLPGATNATLTLANAQPPQAGTYSVIVANEAGAAAPLSAPLVVLDARATQAAPGAGYTPGGEVVLTQTLHYSGSLTALSWQVLLPTGWTYRAGAGLEGEVRPVPGQRDLLEWAWAQPPASPLSFSYTVAVPGNTAGPQPLVALVHARQGGFPIPLLATPDPLSLAPLTHHTADTNRDLRLNLFELTRVIEIYNTRHAGLRTGAYREDSGGEDGFAPEPARAAGATFSPGRPHSADANRDGRVSLFELTRVVELFNTREAGIRTGRYRISPGTEDGFTPGP